MTSSKRNPNAKNLFVLLVEPEESTSITIERCLHECSRLTDIVTHLLNSAITDFDGKDLIEELQRKRYNCILMDLALPGSIDGIALSRMVRQQIADPPAILLLAQNITPLLKTRAHAAGVREILDRDKLTPATLRRVIDLALQTGSLPSS